MKVLIVDDEKLIRDVIKEYCILNNFDTIEAENGIEAIEKEDVSLLPYPNSFENQILEIGPKGQKSDDAYNTFFNKDVTKTCFFLNKGVLFEKKF